MKNAFDYLNNVKMDFDVYNVEPVSEKETECMIKKFEEKKKRRPEMKKIYAIAACAAMLAIAGTAFAGGYADKILKVITVGKNMYIQTDSSVPEILPDSMVGMIFDKNGQVLTAISRDDVNDLYDADGNQLSIKELESMFKEIGEEQGVTLAEGGIEKNRKCFDDFESAQSAAVFDIKTPEYIPEGYSLSEIYTYTEDDGSYSGEYINYEYTNGSSDISIMERVMNDSTAYVMSSTGEVEETEINGRRAVIMGGRSIQWDTEDSVNVAISSDLPKSEMIKIANSVS